MNLFSYKALIVLSLFISTCQLQKPTVEGRRHDVYIAGFFPFGRGVENSNTGSNNNLLFILATKPQFLQVVESCQVSS